MSTLISVGILVPKQHLQAGKAEGFLVQGQVSKNVAMTRRVAAANIFFAAKLDPGNIGNIRFGIRRYNRGYPDAPWGGGKIPAKISGLNQGVCFF